MHRTRSLVFLSVAQIRKDCLKSAQFKSSLCKMSVCPPESSIVGGLLCCAFHNVTLASEQNMKMPPKPLNISAAFLLPGWWWSASGQYFHCEIVNFLTPSFSRTIKQIFEPNKQSFNRPLNPQIDFFFENCNHWHYFCTLWKGWKSLKVNSVPISARCFWELNYPPRNQDSH